MKCYDFKRFLCILANFASGQSHPYIFPSFPYVIASVTGSPAAANGTTDISFGMQVCLDCGMLIFGKLGSKVKGQCQVSMKIGLFWANLGHRGNVRDYLGPWRVRWGTFGSMPTNFGNLPKVRERREACSR